MSRRRFEIPRNSVQGRAARTVQVSRQLWFEPLEHKQLLAVDLTASMFETHQGSDPCESEYASSPPAAIVESSAGDFDRRSSLGFQILDGATIEGDVATVYVRLPEPLNVTSSVDVTISSGTATIGQDSPNPESESFTLVFSPGETLKHMTFPTISDGVAEPTETFVATLSRPVNGEIAVESAHVTIRDVNTKPEWYVTARKGKLEDAGFVVNLSNPYEKSTSIDWVIERLSPDASRESLEVASGRLVLPARMETATIKVPNLLDGIQAYRIQISNPEDGGVGGSGMSDLHFPVGTIVPSLGKDSPVAGPVKPDEFGTAAASSLPVLSLWDHNRPEGHWLKMIASLAPSVTNPVTAFYRIHNGTATYLADYANIKIEAVPNPFDPLIKAPGAGAMSAGPTGSISWSTGGWPGRIIWVQALHDNVDEPDENFTLRVYASDVNGATLECNCGEEVATGTISDVLPGIDTDSNNDGVINADDANLEDTSYKRIFLNQDDDNTNGKSDLLDGNSAYVNAFHGQTAEPKDDNDFAEITLGLKGPALSSEFYNDYTLRLSYDGAAFYSYASTKKQSVNGTPVAQGYVWTLGQPTLNSPGYTVPLPDRLYLEGRQTGQFNVSLQLIKGTSIVSSDTVKIRVEDIVWPFENQASNYQLGNTSTWNGLKLAPAWYIDKALVDYIKTPGSRGNIETIHPDLDDPYTAGIMLTWASNAGADSRVYFGTNSPNFSNGFTMEFDYEYEKIRGDGQHGYVRIHNANAQLGSQEPQKLSFVGNSGVKFGGDTGKEMEIAILDVQSYTAKGGGLTQFSGFIDGTGNVSASYNGVSYDPEPLKKLMTGVHYDSPNYFWMLDSPAYNPSLPDNPNGTPGYVATHANSHGNAIGTIKIVVTKLTGTNYKIEVFMGLSPNALELIYSDPQRTITNLSLPYLQSHWGSGVRFARMTVN